MKFKVSGLDGRWVVSGDLVGIYYDISDKPGYEIRGVEAYNAWLSYFEITRGSVPGVTKLLVQTRNQNVRTKQLISQGNVFENRGTIQVISGCKKATLAYRGTYTSPPGYTDWTFEGVICTD